LPKVMTANTPEAWDERAAEPFSWNAALWSERGQTQRFLAVLRHLDLRAGDALLDFGCGTGRFCEFLPDDVTYYACDSSPGMRERVRREHPRAWVLEELSDDEFDHIVCIGTFNLEDSWSKFETWETLDDLWSINSPRSLIVSFYRGEDEDCLSYDTEEVVEFAEELTSSFIIDATFLANDLLLVMNK